MLDWQAGGKCSRHYEAIIVGEVDIFNIRSDKLGYTTVIRSVFPLSSLCPVLSPLNFQEHLILFMAQN